MAKTQRSKPAPVIHCRLSVPRTWRKYITANDDGPDSLTSTSMTWQLVGRDVIYWVLDNHLHFEVGTPDFEDTGQTKYFADFSVADIDRNVTKTARVDNYRFNIECKWTINRSGKKLEDLEFEEIVPAASPKR